MAKLFGLLILMILTVVNLVQSDEERWSRTYKCRESRNTKRSIETPLDLKVQIDENGKTKVIIVSRIGNSVLPLIIDTTTSTSATTLTTTPTLTTEFVTTSTISATTSFAPVTTTTATTIPITTSIITDKIPTTLSPTEAVVTRAPSRETINPSTATTVENSTAKSRVSTEPTTAISTSSASVTSTNNTEFTSTCSPNNTDNKETIYLGVMIASLIINALLLGSLAFFIFRHRQLWQANRRILEANLSRDLPLEDQYDYPSVRPSYIYDLSTPYTRTNHGK